MLYVVIPHVRTHWGNIRMFTSYEHAEQAVLLSARGFELEGYSPDWCTLIEYHGTDELYPAYVYFIVDSNHLHRDVWPTPSP